MDEQRKILGPHSSTGPEAPPSWFGAVNEPTQQLPRVRPKPPKVLGRAVPTRTVVVAEPEPRRRWGLPVFAAVLVALTIGVILGQTAAYQDSTVYASQRIVPTPAEYSTPPQTPPVPTPSAQSLPAVGERVSAPLGKDRELRFDITGTATLITIRSVDLGDRLYDIATLDGSAVPKIVKKDTGPRLTIARTGATGRLGAEVQLNSRVRWTLRLIGGAAEQEVDMRAGGLAGVELIGGASRTVLRLAEPKGTVRMTATGGISQLDVYPTGKTPVRVRLTKGATDAVVDGKARHKVKPDTVLDSEGWKSAKNRYDITTKADLSVLHVDHQ
jgi:hypothetical protein